MREGEREGVKEGERCRAYRNMKYLRVQPRTAAPQESTWQTKRRGNHPVLLAGASSVVATIWVASWQTWLRRRRHRCRCPSSNQAQTVPLEWRIVYCLRQRRTISKLPVAWWRRRTTKFSRIVCRCCMELKDRKERERLRENKRKIKWGRSSIA